MSKKYEAHITYPLIVRERVVAAANWNWKFSEMKSGEDKCYLTSHGNCYDLVLASMQGKAYTCPGWTRMKIEEILYDEKADV